MEDLFVDGEQRIRHPVSVPDCDPKKFERAVDEWNRTTVVMVALGGALLVLLVIRAPQWLLLTLVAVMGMAGAGRCVRSLRRTYGPNRPDPE